MSPKVVIFYLLHWATLIHLLSGGKFCTPVSNNEDLNYKITEVRSTIEFQLENVLCLDVHGGANSPTRHTLTVTSRQMGQPHTYHRQKHSSCDWTHATDHIFFLVFFHAD